MVRPAVPTDRELMERAVENVEAFRGCSDAVFGPQARTIERDGLAIGCAGLIDCGAGAALAWALVAPEAAFCLLGCCRAFRGFLATSGLLWIEAHIAPEFAASERLARLVGFRPLGAMIEMPDGRTFNRWVLR